MKRSSESNHDTDKKINVEFPAKMQRSIRSTNWDLYHEARDGNLDRVEELITQGANVNNQDGESNSSPLHIACKNTHVAVVQCLLGHHADVNIRDENGHTPLHVAVNNNIDKAPAVGDTREHDARVVVKLLIENNADIHARDSIGRTPLHVCVKHPTVTEVLLSAGADCNLLDNKNRNTLHYVIDERVAEILCRAEIDLNLQDMNGRTPLHEASWFNRHEVVRVLIRAGADIDIKDKVDVTAYQMAKARESKQVTEMLSKWKETKKLSISESQENGTALPTEILQMDQHSIEIYKEALKAGIECDYTIRLMVVGAQGVGKTSLINLLMKLGLELEEIESTNGIDVHIRRSAVNVHNGKWILDKEDVMKLINHDVRLGKVVVASYKDTKEDSNVEPYQDLETDGGVKENAKTKSSLQVGECGISKGTEGITESVYNPEEAVSGVKEDHDAKIKENLLKVIDAMKMGGSEDTYGLISVWDFGGDFIFYTTHQTFLSTRGIYLVVVDITKTLFDEFKDGDCYVDISGLKYLKMGEYVVFWLNSIHTYAGNNQDGVPPVILVATHLDKIQGDKVSKKEELFDKVRNCLMENGMSLYDHLDDDDFGVDNTKSADDPDLERLRQKIFEVAKTQKYWGEEKPASWIAFEKILIDKQNNGIKMLSFEEVKELSKGLESGVMDHDQLDVFLKFQHAIGNLIYFSDLNEYVVLDPKWLIYAFRCLITHEKFNKKMPFAIRAKWCKFSKTAELKREVIDALWNEIDENHREHLLGLMDKLDIIAKPMTYKGSEDASSNQELDYYFVPAMLKDRITDDQLHCIEENARITPNMYFVFQNHYISPSVFHRLIAACMKQWKIAHQENKKLLFCGCGIFTIDESQTTRIMICMENYRIKVRVLYYLDQNDSILPDDVSKFVDIRHFVEETLKNIFGKYQQKIPYKLHIECSPSGGGLIAVDTLKKYPKINCTTHDKYCHPVLSRQLLKYWFNPEEYQNSLDTEDSKEKNLNDLPFGFSDHRPSEKQLMDIAKCIGSDFVQLAINLDFETHEIQTIEHDYPNDLLRQCFDMLVRWKRRSGKGTLGILHKIMCDVGCNTQGFSSACMRTKFFDH